MDSMCFWTQPSLIIKFYANRFGGALIAYNNIQVQQAMGLIVDPYIHFDIVADFIVFK